MITQCDKHAFQEKAPRAGEKAASAIKALGDTLQRIKQERPEFYEHLKCVKSN